MDIFLEQYLSDITALFSNSQQRLYWGYLLCAVFIAALYNIHKHPNNIKTALSTAAGLPHWFSKSAIADYQLIIINKAIYLLCNPILIGKLSIATLIFELMHQWIGQRQIESDLPSWVIVTAFTVFLFIFDDFARFYTHKLLHEIPYFWEFHKTHHSATSLTPLTVLRTHPVEGILFAIRSAVVQGISIALFVFWFADKVDLYTVLKVNIFIFIFNVAGANLRHSHISIRYYNLLENIFISPAQHHIHHSNAPRHFNKNYGAILAIWDKMFNTHCYSEENTLSFGLSKNQSVAEQSLQKLYFSAFANCYRMLKTQINKSYSAVFNSNQSKM